MKNYVAKSRLGDMKDKAKIQKKGSKEKKKSKVWSARISLPLKICRAALAAEELSSSQAQETRRWASRHERMFRSSF